MGLYKIKKDNPQLNCLFGSNVGVAGFEPAASCSQSRRDNRATLHPEARAKIGFNFTLQNDLSEIN